MAIESRNFKIALREEGEQRKIAGLAAPYNQIAHGEMIAPGAFTKTLAEQKDIKAFWSHNSAKPLGRTTNGTLNLRESEDGLVVEIIPNLSTTFGADALASVQRGDVDQMSFGFAPVKESMQRIEDQDVRILQEVRLYEVSPVAEPWYSGTSAIARHKPEEDKEIKTDKANEPEPNQAVHSTPEAEIESIEIEAQKRERELQLLEIQGEYYG